MTWFWIALLLALGGIFAAYVGIKKMPKIVPKEPAGPKIDLDNPGDVQRYTKEMGVDKWDLEDAVRDAGPNADKVRKELGNK